MKLDASGNIFIAGISNLNTFYNDVSTIKINADGITEWYHLIRNDYKDMVVGLELDMEGRCYLGGRLGDIFLEQGGFVLRYDNNGDVAWIDTTTGVNAVCIDSAGNFYNLYSLVKSGFVIIGVRNLSVIKQVINFLGMTTTEDSHLFLVSPDL